MALIVLPQKSAVLYMGRESTDDDDDDDDDVDDDNDDLTENI